MKKLIVGSIIASSLVNASWVNETSWQEKMKKRTQKEKEEREYRETLNNPYDFEGKITYYKTYGDKSRISLYNKIDGRSLNIEVEIYSINRTEEELKRKAYGTCYKKSYGYYKDCSISFE